MVIFKDRHRFELTVDDLDGAWQATLREFVPGRLYPTRHLLRAFGTRQAAITSLIRKWHVLFPDDAPLAWHEPPPVSVGSRDTPARPEAPPRQQAARRRRTKNRRSGERGPRS
jgi:hypothetical protein